jgi:hypothetical protein
MAMATACDRLPQSSVAKFYDARYGVPARLAITVRFQATNGDEIAAVFAIRTIRSQPGIQG